MPSPTPEEVALVRCLHAEGLSVARIMRETGLSRYYVNRCVLPGDGDGHVLPPERHGKPAAGVPEAGRRTSLVLRLWRAADRQVRDVEARLATGEQAPAERERDVRTLAVLVKTLRDLTALEAKRFAAAAQAAPGSDDDAANDPRSFEDLRRELAERIDRLRRERRPAEAAGQL